MIWMKTIQRRLPGSIIHILLLLFLPFIVFAQPASLPFQDCFRGNVSQKLQVSAVYAQLLDHTRLNLTVLGVAPTPIVATDNDTNPVATTLFTKTSMLTFNVWNNASYFCNTLRPQSPLPPLGTNLSYCPLAPGPFAFASTINLPTINELTTFNTQLRASDPNQNELLCIIVATTPLKPHSDSPLPYGHADIIFWITVSLAIAYWLVVGLARIVSAWGRGLGRSTPGVWRRMESAGFILASALSGERLATSPALLRFCTPSLRDIIFHSQWCAALGMVAVQWPQFVYPLLSQTAWSMLSYNITITQHGPNPKLWNPLSVPPYNPPSNFADQLNDAASPIFIDKAIANTLFMLPANVTTGIPAFAAAVGLHPSDLFGITLTLFLSICGAVVVLSAFVWIVDHIATTVSRSVEQTSDIRSPHFGSTSKDLLGNTAQSPQNLDENRSNSHLMPRTLRFMSSSKWRLNPGFSSLHGSVLQGNLVRVLVLFHFPVTIFSCYQLAIGRSQASTSSIILAAFSFLFLSIFVPVILLFRLYVTNTSKLYDETWTLLALGPLYNHYRHGSQLFACLLFATNLAFGITIGCGQKNGTVQAIVILVIEVVSALGTSFWLPWGQGASMGLISFLFCVARIVIAVLMVILAPVVSIAQDAGQWVTYAILVILALVYLALILMLLVKFIEASVRIFSGVGFHKSRHVVDSGLLGVSALAGCCGSRKKQRSEPKKPRNSGGAASSQMSLTRPATHKNRLSSHTNSAPPSVLRPEHALQPYREESDDEEGFIMGAWHSFQRPGYTSVEQPSPSTPKAGFMRVGGGRSHYDTPYAIQASSSTTFPSVEKTSIPSKTNRMSNSPPPTPSITYSVAQSLPSGAMPPAHIRTKSQSAVIELTPFSVDAAASDTDQMAPPPHRRNSEDDTSLEMAQPKKKPWYQIRRTRRHSDGNMASEVRAEPPTSAPATGRSFVVVRKGQQANTDPPASSPDYRGRSQSGPSFVVLRGNNADEDNDSSSGIAL